MQSLESIVAVLDYMTNTSRKKHIVGGILLSASLLFGGLAFTVMAMKIVEEGEDYYEVKDDSY